MSKLSDSQLIILSSASRRDDGLVIIPENLKPKGNRLVRTLLKGGLLEEIKATAQMPSWRRDEDGPYALRITKAGLAVIGISSTADSSIGKGGLATAQSSQAPTRGKTRKPRASPIANGPCKGVEGQTTPRHDDGPRVHLERT